MLGLLYYQRKGSEETFGSMGSSWNLGTFPQTSLFNFLNSLCHTLKHPIKHNLSYPPGFSCQTLLLQIGEAMLVEEAQKAAEEKRMYLEDKCPTLAIPACMQSLQVNLALKLKV